MDGKKKTNKTMTVKRKKKVIVCTFFFLYFVYTSITKNKLRWLYTRASGNSINNVKVISLIL